MGKEKKKFKDTKFGKFLNKAGNTLKENVGDIAGIGLKVATGNISGAIEDATDMIKGNDTPEAKELLQELEIRKQEFELDLYKTEIEDRDSARKREVEVLKAGGGDVMMKVSGFVGLGSFLLCLCAILFMDLPDANMKLVYHILGIVEGVALSIYGYYYGTSKSSADKNSIIDKIS